MLPTPRQKQALSLALLAAVILFSWLALRGSWDQFRIEQVISALHEVQLEVARMENQEAIIDGFGVMSGRVKGPATGHG